MRVVVVGSGIVGAAAGYESVRAGVDVVLVDSRAPGRATSAGAGSAATAAARPASSRSLRPATAWERPV
ncbi:FAD-dependent oxidoreductase [Streptomyces sp. NPDC088816]|uniref:FAD-dependent oxidoreductase n=1 Tax=Streptomyces sp. NPDC088816 TaxID=3365906 RepID=UPI0037FCEB44